MRTNECLSMRKERKFEEISKAVWLVFVLGDFRLPVCGSCVKSWFRVRATFAFPYAEVVSNPGACGGCPNRTVSWGPEILPKAATGPVSRINSMQKIQPKNANRVQQNRLQSRQLISQAKMNASPQLRQMSRNSLCPGMKQKRIQYLQAGVDRKNLVHIHCAIDWYSLIVRGR